MRWLNEPADWRLDGDTLHVTAGARTDFWRRTHYGFIRHSGHVYGELVPGDVTVRAHVAGAYAAQYDQAGVMAVVDEHTWLKAGIELYEGRPRLSTVVTHEYSSWAFSNLPAATSGVWLRLTRVREALELHYSLDGHDYELASVSYLPEGSALVGVACAAPDGDGFPVTFTHLSITPA